MKKNSKKAKTHNAADYATSRRDLLKTGFLAAAGLQISWAKDLFAADRNDTLVVLFLRGGADGLSMVQPAAGADYNAYVAARPNLHIRSNQSLALGTSGFRCHPALTDMRNLFNQGKLSVVMGAGSTNGTRSHFEQQDLIEMGNPDRVSGIRSGYMNRALTELTAKSVELPGVSVTDALSLALRGPQPTVAVRANLTGYTNLGNATVVSGIALKARVQKTWTTRPDDFRKVDYVADASGRQTIRALDRLAEAEALTLTQSANYAPEYHGLKTAVRLMKADSGIRMITADVGGWDHHKDMGVLNGTFNNRMIALNQSVKAFYDDLVAHSLSTRVTLIIMSEFGRRLVQNGTSGLDHGRGGVMWVMGGQVKGGKVVSGSNWNLTSLDGGDMRVTVDYRRVIAEFLSRRAGASNDALTKRIFPRYTIHGVDLFKA